MMPLQSTRTIAFKLTSRLLASVSILGHDMKWGSISARCEIGDIQLNGCCRSCWGRKIARTPNIFAFTQQYLVRGYRSILLSGDTIIPTTRPEGDSKKRQRCLFVAMMLVRWWWRDVIDQCREVVARDTVRHCRCIIIFIIR